MDNVKITGIWLRRSGDELHVLVEVNKQWHKAIVEHFDGNISHIVEPAGILSAPVEK